MARNKRPDELTAIGASFTLLFQGLRFQSRAEYFVAHQQKALASFSWLSESGLRLVSLPEIASFAMKFCELEHPRP